MPQGGVSATLPFMTTGATDRRDALPTPAQRLADARASDDLDEPPKVVLFWSHRRERDGSVGWGCFSQWWPAATTVEGVVYPTSEHWMMAAKARLFGDDVALARILRSPDPGAAKAAGREVRGFDEASWERERYDIVLDGTRAKFIQHPDLLQVLRRTGDRLIAEASPVDAVWGIGLAADHPDAVHPTFWRGLNLLGFALMDVRDELTREGSPQEERPRRDR